MFSFAVLVFSVLKGILVRFGETLKGLYGNKLKYIETYFN